VIEDAWPPYPSSLPAILALDWTEEAHGEQLLEVTQHPWDTATLQLLLFQL